MKQTYLRPVLGISQPYHALLKSWRWCSVFRIGIGVQDPGRWKASLLAMLGGAALLFASSASAQNLLEDSGFELGLTTGPGDSVYSPATIGAWTVSGTLYVYGMPVGNIPTYEGNEAVNPISSANSLYRGAAHQSIPTTVGTSYRVSLAVAWGNARVIASGSGVTNLVADVISPGTTIPITWATNSYTFTATASITTITVSGAANNGYSPLVDDVQLVELPILQDGGFELGLTSGPGSYYSSSTYGAWSAGGGSGTYMFGMPYGVTPAYEGNEAVLIGNGGQAGYVQQSFQTAIGQQYWLSYALNVADGHNGSARATVFTASQTDLNQVFVAPGGSKWGVASYPFVASGTSATVKIQNVSDASIIDDVRLSPIALDMAVKLDGVNDHATLGSTINLANQSFTLEVWAKRADANTGYQFLFAQGASAGNQLLHVGFHDNKPTFRFYGNDYDAPVTCVDRAWHHWAFVYYAPLNTREIYRDGVLVGENVASADYAGSGTMYLGRYTTSAYHFNGQMDEVRIWNVARTESQIRGQLNARLTGSESGLVAYHRMDDGTLAGTTLADATGHGHTGTLVNGPVRLPSTVPADGLATRTPHTFGPSSTQTLTFEGYQPGGIRWEVPGDALWNVELIVTNLTSDITAGTGTAGVELNQLYTGDNLTVRYDGGTHTNFTTNAAGLYVRSKGDNGVTVDDADATAGSTAGTATIISSGTIMTFGDNAAGMHVISEGGAGGTGENSTVLNGEHGGNGGNGINSTAHSSSQIRTTGNNSAGILAVSQGGGGGKGGNSSVASGAYGGVGGNAGDALITGTGEITTTGTDSVGVLAVSIAGRGGNGGSGTVDGGSGNYGGDAGTATIDGNWTVHTSGIDAYGVSARSLGGAGGAAAGGGWLFGDGGIGGGSGDGETAIVNFGLGGFIQTSGREAHGIMAQSIGGFAGAGGGGGSIFSGDGGGGGSAGNGGNVSVTNRGTILTLGESASAVFAESIGGGGGTGGAGSGMFGGGTSSSSAGGDAGEVNVDNRGQLTTANHSARGIFAQSVGGSGGNGRTDSGLFYSVGGSGGNGGDGGNVTVTNSGQITTDGTNAVGILAQSVGGGGGTGGGAVSGGVFGSGALGGSGGGGGDAANVNISSGPTGIILTRGPNAHGILAQSLGGGGGFGGFSLTGSGGAFSGSVGIGGTGGLGGDGSNVVVNSQSSITTEGENAYGILAQSVGGGGGAGGYNIAATGGGIGAASLSFGGDGGAGGRGDSVDVTSSGTIQTAGDRSYGVFAQSLGGGGGAGGFSIAGSVAGSASAPLSFGASGGTGNSGGEVSAEVSGSVTTSGNDAHGIVAQSVGGGGGAGGFAVSGGISGGANIGAAFGGDGGDGGSSSNVTVQSAATIQTSGEHAYGILAQSLGGGGGDGGFSVAGSISSVASLNFAQGGTGGSGGDAGEVEVNSSSTITTTNDNAHGIFAQSLGGGGGSGGFSVAGGISGTASISVSAGGSGGGGGDASDVTLTSTGGAIMTDGDHSYGLLAQSLGGGGGDGGFSVAGGISGTASISFSQGGSGAAGGKGARVALTNESSITTHGDDAHGIFAQSVGGGGGSGGWSVAGGIASGGGSLGVSIGGDGGSGNTASNVTVHSEGGSISTSGDLSHGIFAQSVGGRGGAGAFSVSGGIAELTSWNFSMGGSGGTGGVAGLVLVTNDSAISTSGSNSHAIFAQSVGGGGGSGGFSVAGAIGTGSAGSLQVTVSLGGNGGAGGDGQAATVRNAQSLTTTGDTAHGIFAQSVGGGGGNAGYSFAGSFGLAGAKNISIGVGGSGGAGGTGDDVAVENDGIIDTSGDGSHAIFAQSVGGGGGNGGMATAVNFGVSNTNNQNMNFALGIGGGGGDGNSGGNVNVQNHTNLITRGNRSHGILAQSIGGGGGNGGSSLAATMTLELGGTNSQQPINVAVALGGGGGDGSDGGDVVVNSTGTIETHGDGSSGIYAQSVGGGGGNGGAARALSLDVNPSDWIPKFESEGIGKFLKDMFTTVNVSVGGSGGGGSDGGNGYVTNAGNILTFGNEAHGIFGQTIGGGGGVGGDGANGLPQVEPWMEPFLEFTPLKGLEDVQIVVGGSGGSSGNGGSMIVDNIGTIDTRGHGSHGIMAQSIGGGGGIGGAGAVGLVGKIGVGGDAGSSGNGGAVLVGQSGDITTSGRHANGITAQSVGGGGGMGGNVDRGIAKLGLAVANIPLPFVTNDKGRGGNAGNGGLVAVNSGGNITTSNSASYGIFAQSVGGGGGVAGDVGIGVGFAGSMGGHGDGGRVVVDHAGDVTTYGDAANGIFAQSAGGADIITFAIGDLLNPTNLVLQLKYQSNAISTYVRSRLSSSTLQGVNAYPDSGLVADLTQTNLSADLNTIVEGSSIYDSSRFAGITLRPETLALVNTSPTVVGDDLLRMNRWLLEDAYTGVLAGDFNVGNALGVGGDIDITVTGSVTAHGANANGIFAQSVGLHGGGDINLNILGNGIVYGGSGDSAGVRIDGGANNTVTNFGTITTLNGDAGVAVLGGSGNERVENFGTLVGQVLLGGGINSWINHPGSLFTVQTSLDLGSGNTFDNSGLLTGSGQIVGDVVSSGAINPGNSPGSLAIDGNLSLQAQATLTFEIAGTQQGVDHDFLSVSGSAGFQGVLDLWLADLLEPDPTDSFTLMTFDSSNGSFGNVQNGRVLARDNLGSFRVSYDLNSLVVDDFLSDTDGDGMNDQDEILAGTDWLDASSVLAITSLVRGPSGSLILQFPWVTGNYYSLEYVENPNSTNWTAVLLPEFTFPEPGIAQWIDDGSQTTGTLAGASAFYRVKLVLTIPSGPDMRLSISRDASGDAVLQFTAVPGNAYSVEYTSDLRGGAWIEVPSPVVTFPTPATGQWIDDGSQTGGLNLNSRFYRVRPLLDTGGIGG